MTALLWCVGVDVRNVLYGEYIYLHVHDLYWFKQMLMVYIVLGRIPFRKPIKLYITILLIIDSMCLSQKGPLIIANVMIITYIYIYIYIYISGKRTICMK